MEIYWNSIVVLLSKLILVLGSRMFFHEPSYININPDAAKNSDFGFSLAFQDKTDSNLLIGAPHSMSVLGDVFVCPIDSIMSNKPSCIPVKTDLRLLAPETEYNVIHPKQKFCLGASIVATPDYFVSCAPLWSTRVSTLRHEKNYLSTVGTCFIYNEEATTRYTGMVEQYNYPEYENDNRTIDLMRDQTGWNVYYGKTYEDILFGKLADIIYLDARNVRRPAKSLRNDYFEHKKERLKLGATINLGQSITSGNFFAGTQKSFYVAAMQNRNLGGQMLFIQKKGKNNPYMKINEDISISGPATAMYGRAVLSSDVNQDGVADLIVGAPAFTKVPENYETGALFIHLGGDKDIGSITRQFIIYGSMDGSRFGATLAKSDIDGDGFPELFVSAPYEQFDDSTGALYVISGYEIQYIIRNEQHRVNLNDLEYVQKIKVKGLNAFGYSLQVVKDVDSNGCDELAVGAPASATVVLLRCLPRIKVHLVLTLTPGSNNQDIVNVCINIWYPEKPEKIMTKLKVVCKITQDGATILGTNVVEADLTSRLPQYCNNITIQYLYKESLSHDFIAKLDVEQLEKELSQNKFNSGWVTVSQYSKTEAILNIIKPCLDTSKCNAELEAHFLWSNNLQPVSDIDYTIGKSETENVTLVVVSKGIPTFGCVQLKINAAASIPCARDGLEGYLCNLKPIEREQQQNIKMVVKMNEFSNEDTQLKIKATWYPICHNKNSFDSTELNIKLKLIPEIYIKSSSHYLDVTEKEITNQEPLNDTMNIFKDNHEYTITNNNSVHWINVGAEIKINSLPFMSSQKITITKDSNKKTQDSVCNSTKTLNETIFYCPLSLKPRSTAKLIITTDILKTKIRENLKNKMAVIVSNITIILSPTDVKVKENQMTIILLQKEAYIRDNKLMIIIIAILSALLIMCLMIYILYRLGFFERETKKQLNTMRESIRRKNSQDVLNQDNSNGEDEDEKNDINLSVDDDCEYEIIGLNQRDVDTNALIELKTEVDVHKEDDSKRSKGTDHDKTPKLQSTDRLI